MPKATAGTSRVVKWTRRKLCTTQYTRHSLCNPVVALAYILVLRRNVAHLRRRELRACLKRSCFGCQTPHHQLNHGDSDPCLGRLRHGLKVFTQPPRTIEPAERAFD